MSLKFEIIKKLDQKLGRAGIITTAHGIIETPAFVVVGTKGTVKSLNSEQVRDAGAQVVLGNTYHLYLQPGDEAVKEMGGLGNMMNWSGPTMTDSGGFQVFSLGAAYKKGISKVLQITDPSLMIPERFDDSDAPRLVKIGQDGVSFTSHLDGSVHYITPEKSIDIQHNIGADIIFAFDECTSPNEDLKYQGEALDRTHAWAKRSLEEHVKLESGKRSVLEEERSDGKGETLRSFPQYLFGIVQGGRDEELRKKSAKFIADVEVDGKKFDGFGIGGSFAKEDMQTAVKWVNEILPEEKPRHLLGIGEPEDLFMGIESGVDLFDCVLPTRNGRNGTLYTKTGKIHIGNNEFRRDIKPIEEDCPCYTCQNYSKAYICHLFHGKEMLAGTLASIHNVHFLVNLVKQIRQSILDGNFEEYKKEFLGQYKKEKDSEN
jgi:queuine tRNA-ribosyltransferase